MLSGGAVIGPARHAALDLLDRTFRSKPLVFVLFAWMAGIGLADHWTLTPAMAGGVGLLLGMATLARRRRWGSLVTEWLLAIGAVGLVLLREREQVSRVESGETRMHVIAFRLYCRTTGLDPAEFVAELEGELQQVNTST
jgi:hypothetical protein